MRLLLWSLILSEALGLRMIGQPYYGYELPYVFIRNFSTFLRLT